MEEDHYRNVQLDFAAIGLNERHFFFLSQVKNRVLLQN